MVAKSNEIVTGSDTDSPAAKPAFDLIARVAASIRRERERADFSLGELSKRAGVAKSTLSQLESGTGNPSIETLWALAVALNVPVSRFIDAPRRHIEVIRRGEGPTTASQQSNYAAVLLAASPSGVRRDVYQLYVQPGPPKVSQSHAPGTIEHLVISAGRALAGPLDAPVELGPGDYMSYPADEPHVFTALEPDTTAVLVIECP